MKVSKMAKNLNPSETLSLYKLTAELKNKGVDFVNFSAGEPDFDTPENIKQAAINAINDNFTRYTISEGVLELRQAICDELEKECGVKYSPECIVVSNGSKHALKNVFTAILNKGDEVIVPAPYWNSYIDIINMVYGVSVVVETKKEFSFKVTVEQLKQALTKKTRAIIINSPNNPSGMVYSREELEEIAEFAVENDLYVISDEIYRKMTYSRKLKHVSIASLNDEIKKRTIIVDSLSKSYAMTGWRVGFSACDKKLAGIIASIQSNSTSNVNSIAQIAAVEALRGDKEYIEQMLTEFKHRRDYIAQRISDIPFLSSMLPKGAFFLFVDVSKLFGCEVKGKVLNNSEDVANALFEHYKVLTVPSSVFGYDGYIRISYATSMRDIVSGTNRIEKFIKENF